MEPGVSVVVTTWNGAAWLPGTLAALLAQRVPPGLPWEVFVVDNASTDDSARIAAAVWPLSAPAPLRVLEEKRQGVLHANHRALREARYGLLSLVNDDNRPEPDFVARVAAFMDAHPAVGGLGSRGVAEPERPLPEWFERFQLHYAVGEQAEAAGPLKAPERALWGACSTFRTATWRELLANGFAPRDEGRQRRRLRAGEDYELCYALRLAGHALWYEPSLVFRHYLPAFKLDWRWHRRMHRGFGASVVQDAYVRALAGLGPSRAESLRLAWLRECLWTAARLARFAGHLAFGDRLPGDPAVVLADQLAGRLGALLRWRGGYDDALREVREAPWRRPSAT